MTRPPRPKHQPRDVLDLIRQRWATEHLLAFEDPHIGCQHDVLHLIAEVDLLRRLLDSEMNLVDRVRDLEGRHTVMHRRAQAAESRAAIAERALQRLSLPPDYCWPEGCDGTDTVRDTIST